MAGRALIAGAGIAGLSLAISLARRGVKSRIVERAARLDEVGAGVQLSPNAGCVLDALDLGAALDSAATRPEGVAISNAATGQILRALPFGETAERRWGAPYRVIHRGDLQTILLETARGEDLIELTLGAEIADTEETPGGVALTLTDGGRVEGDWLAGCDGLNSVVRRAVKLPAGARASGLKAFRTALPASTVPSGIDMSRVGVWLGAGAHAVVYPVRQGREANVVVIGDERAISADALAKDWAGPIRELIAAGRNWTPWPLHDRAPDARMVRGRVALLGDASHAALPSLAQGAAFAIEDAATLARVVAERGPDGLKAYEDARLMRVARLQTRSRQQIRIDHMSGLKAFARNAALRLAPEAALLGGLDWLYGWRDR